MENPPADPRQAYRDYLRQREHALIESSVSCSDRTCAGCRERNELSQSDLLGSRSPCIGQLL
eukprot:5901700-Heterocapsa_arctica.AAC.1